VTCPLLVMRMMPSSSITLTGITITQHTVSVKKDMSLLSAFLWQCLPTEELYHLLHES